MHKNPVVLQVLPALEMGGVERGTLEMAALMRAQGWENYVVSSGGPLVYQLEKAGGSHICLPVQTKNPFKMWLNARRIAQIIRDKKITLVHARSRAPAWSVKWACRKTGVPFIATFHGFYGLKPRWLKKPYNRVMTQGKLVIAVSRFIQEHLEEEYGVPPEKIRLILRGADTDKFNADTIFSERVTSLLTFYQISPEKPIITLVARLTKIKGHAVLLDALTLMKNKDVTCLFIGSEQGRVKYVRSLEERVKKLSPLTNVQMIRSGKDMPALYLMSDIVVAPAIAPEAFGRTVTEAQAMGRIVVASAFGGACETIRDGVTGFLVPPNNPAALAAKLDEIFEMNLSARKKMQQASIASVRAHFSIKTMCEKTIQVYKEASL